MNFGLTSKVFWQIQHKLKEFEEIESAYIFGSRAIGNYKKISDIDICIKGKKISFNTLSHLLGEMEEKISTALRFDIVDWNRIENEKLREHIEEFGKKIY